MELHQHFSCRQAATPLHNTHTHTHTHTHTQGHDALHKVFKLAAHTVSLLVPWWFGGLVHCKLTVVGFTQLNNSFKIA